MVLSQASHCALIILMELARHYELRGVLLSEISEEHRIPEEILKPIAKRLCELDITCCQAGEGSDIHYLLLKRDPYEISAYDIIMLFDGEVFSGRFFNSETGKLFPKSRLNNMINFERQHMVNYMRKRLKKINIKFWSESALRMSNY